MDILSIIGLILAVGMVLFGIMFDSDDKRNSEIIIKKWCCSELCSIPIPPG